MNDYVRTDAELAHQRAYEAREASLHGSAAQIHYRLIESKPEPDPVVRKIAWRVGRKVGDGKESISAWFYRRVEAIQYVKEQMERDASAAKRLGVHVHTTVGR